MSLRVLTLVWDRFPEGGSKLLTMLALADWGGDDGGRIYPSMEALAAKLRLSKRQAIRVLQDLQSGLWITCLTPENLGGRGSKSRYKINIETLSKCPILYRKRAGPGVVDNSKINGDIFGVNGDILAVNGDTISPESEAVSQIPRQPLENRYKNRTGDPDKPVDNSGNWASPEGQKKIETLTRYIAQMKLTPYADEREIERAEAELLNYLPEPVQADLLAPKPTED